MTAYNYECPHCHEQIELDEDPSGCTFECPSCRKDFTVYEVNAHMTRPRRSASRSPKPRLTHCYWYGLLLGVVGVFVSHMTDGQDGARMAARGLLIQFVLIAGAILIFMLAPTIAGLISR